MLKTLAIAAIVAAGFAFASATNAFDGTPKLAIPIPTIKFTDLGPAEGGKTYDLPWIAEYIAGIYRYSVGFGGIIATVMVIIGGFQYLTAGGDSGRVKAGKQRIADAVIGLLLLVGSYVVLYTVNPDLVSLQSLRLLSIKKDTLAQFAYADPESPTGKYLQQQIGPSGTGGKLTEADKGSMKPPYDALKVPPASSCKSKAISQAVRDDFYKMQLKTGIPAAVSMAQWAVESAYGKSCIGPPDKKFNCGGIKCFTTKYEGRDTLKSSGTRPACPDTCISVGTLERRQGTPPKPPVYDEYWSCFQIVDTFDAYHAKHNKVVQRKTKNCGDWDQYNGNPNGFANWVQCWGYATAPNYAEILQQVMKRECLIG